MDYPFKCFSKIARFADLAYAVQHCTLCPRLCERTKVLSAQNGNIESAVVFVAEAPGRLGADRTGIPLYGDKSGDNFEKLLGTIGWRREDLFITNAVLCNPREANGNNDTPTQEEIANCSRYLEMTIELVNPQVVVSLGATALRALDRIRQHGLTLKGSVAKPSPWFGRILFPLYHPGPRALVHRSFAKQTADVMLLAKVVDPRKGLVQRRSLPKKRGAGYDVQTLSNFQHAVCQITQTLGKITYFRLTKLLYLIDLTALDRLGHTITGEIFLRQPEGPWPPALQKQIPPLENREVRVTSKRRLLTIEPGPSPRFEPLLDDAALEIVADVLEQYGHLTNAQIKSVAYRTPPMRYILEQERNGRDMRRIPVIYKDRCAPQTDDVAKKD